MKKVFIGLTFGIFLVTLNGCFKENEKMQDVENFIYENKEEIIIVDENLKIESNYYKEYKKTKSYIGTYEEDDFKAKKEIWEEFLKYVIDGFKDNISPKETGVFEERYSMWRRELEKYEEKDLHEEIRLKALDYIIRYEEYMEN